MVQDIRDTLINRQRPLAAHVGRFASAKSEPVAQGQLQAGRLNPRSDPNLWYDPVSVTPLVTDQVRSQACVFLRHEQRIVASQYRSLGRLAHEPRRDATDHQPTFHTLHFAGKLAAL